ncbi:MAG TPA: NAD(P)H-hydrate dehydratase, partial [Thermoanaerobaculia bacterium]|nr:NAD(P)H-hydrate dehydratase [Thermoanaerobaculia bacterium]
TWGHVAAVAGSEGRSGAAILTARGAIRMGAGLVTVLTDAETAAVVDAASVESMSFAIARNSGGLERIIESVKAKDAAVVGPGLPDDEESYELVRELLPRIGIPLVVDASALNAFAGAIGRLGREGSVRVLTPHPGELGRLLGTTTGEVVADRVGAARRAAGESGAVVVLKGHQTLIASPDGMVRVNPTGNPGLASGGTGDVLSGMIAALLAQGHGAADAAAAAVWLHGYAADLLASDASEIGLRAMELADAIPRAIAAVRRLAAPER